MSKFFLFYNTVKYMTYRQWYYRLFYSIRNKLINRYPVDVIKINNITKIRYIYTSIHTDNNVVSCAEELLSNVFDTVGGVKLKFNENIDWDLKNNTYRLLCFRLNSFKYLLSLSDAFHQTSNQVYIDKGFYFIDDWLRKNQSRIQGDKWNPYVIAERLMNWIGFISNYCDNEKELREYAKHIAAQAYELKNSIEFQLGANHLLSEARALMYAGKFLSDVKLYDFGKKILLEEMQEQFLPDGGHYERSVSYHVEALQQGFEASMLMKEFDDKDEELLSKSLYYPFVFLNSMIMSNGKIPLVNDAALDYPFLATDFLSVANILGWKPKNTNYGDYSIRWNLAENKMVEELEEKTLFPDTGFYCSSFTSKGHKFSIFFDFGDNGPDYNLGHTHADALNILITVDEKSLLVDSGVFSYMPGMQRDYCRSTAAHNTIEIDGKSNAEIWGAFRVAKRGHTRLLEYVDAEDNVVISASYDGYSKILGRQMIHNRKVCIDKKECIIEIFDSFETKTNIYTGNINYHIGPMSDVRKISNNIITIDNIHTLEFSQSVDLKDCEIAERFGITQNAKLASSCINISNDVVYITKIKLFN